MKYCTLFLCGGQVLHLEAAQQPGRAQLQRFQGSCHHFQSFFLHYLRKIKTKLSHNLSCFSALLKKKKKAFVEKCLENFFLKISSVLKDSYSFGTKRYTDELMWCSTSQFPAVLGFEYTALVTYRQGRSLLINYRGQEEFQDLLLGNLSEWMGTNLQISHLCFLMLQCILTECLQVTVSVGNCYREEIPTPPSLPSAAGEQSTFSFELCGFLMCNSHRRVANLMVCLHIDLYRFLFLLKKIRWWTVVVFLFHFLSEVC